MAAVIKEKDIKNIDNKICFSTSFLSKILKVSAQTINNWEKQGCPKATHGYWCMYDVLEWKEKKLKGNSPKKNVEDMSLEQQKLHYEIQYKKAQSELQEIKKSILNGDYLERKTVINELKTFLIVFRRTAYAMGKKIAAQVSDYVDDAEARKIDILITDTINNALEQMSEGGLEKK